MMMNQQRAATEHGIGSLAKSMIANDAFLVFGLLLIAALVHPYVGLVHDARLYSLQVANHARDALHQQDLFFAYGSQDSFSIFSRVMSPLVTLLGIEHAFWFGWLVATSLLVYAEVRLVKRLVPDSVLALIAMLLVTVSAIPYGGNGVFHVHESFLTARLPAQALVLLALVKFLDGRQYYAVILSVLAMLFHPLMGIWGLAIVVTCAVAPRVAHRGAWLVAAASCLGMSVLLWQPDAGYLLFGRLDTDWFWTGYQVSGHCFLTEWTAADWLHLLAAFTTVLFARRLLNPLASRMCAVTVLYSIAGLAIALVAQWTGYALLLQGQGYRALWVLQTVAVILAAPVSWHLLKQPSGWLQLLGMGIAGYFFQLLPSGCGALPDGSWTSIAIASLAACLVYFTTSWKALPRATQAIMGGLAALALIHSLGICIDVLGYLPQSTTAPIAGWQVATYVTSPLLWCLGSLGLLLLLFHIGRRQWNVVWMVTGLWVCVSVGTHLVQTSRGYRQRFEDGAGDVAFVRAWIDTHRKAGSDLDQVYWPTDTTHIWHGLDCNSYYSWAQIQGVLFSRQVATEARRRGRLVSTFELAPDRSLARVSQRAIAAQYRLFQTHRAGQHPAAADLTKLAQDPLVDWIVLPYRFEGLAAASNGHVYIYDAKQLRRLRQNRD
jgi:hypothetical protein